MKYHDEKNECMDRSQREALQSERLVALVYRVYEKCAHYRGKMDAHGVKPSDIKDIRDITKLPFTTKDDLRATYPFGMFNVPMKDIVRIHASSGTTGKPTVVGYTQKDLDIWAESMARTMVSGGGDETSIVQNAFGYGLFTGGLGAHIGAERIGAAVIPVSGGNTKRQIMFMQDFGTTLLSCTPSYALFLGETMRDMGIDPDSLPLKYGVFGAEPWTEGMRQEIQKKLGIRATDIYGLSEITGPGVAYECAHQCGMHVNEDYFYPEVIDTDTLQQVQPGDQGELVFTTLIKEGLPLLRYRTRDISTLETDICACGRTLVRMHKVVGRSDDMLIIRGVNVFPSQIEEVLANHSAIEPHYMIIVDRKDNLDVLEVQVEMSDQFFSDAVKNIEAVRDQIAAEIFSILNLGVKVTLVEPKTLARSEGKAKRVDDRRVL